MPRGTLVVVIVHELIPPAILMRVAQMAEPTRIDMLPMAVVEIDRKAAQLYLRVHSRIPLDGTKGE